MYFPMIFFSFHIALQYFWVNRLQSCIFGKPANLLDNYTDMKVLAMDLKYQGQFCCGLRVLCPYKSQYIFRPRRIIIVSASLVSRIIIILLSMKISEAAAVLLLGPKPRSCPKSSKRYVATCDEENKRIRWTIIPSSNVTIYRLPWKYQRQWCCLMSLKLLGPKTIRWKNLSRENVPTCTNAKGVMDDNSI